MFDTINFDNILIDKFENNSIYALLYNGYILYDAMNCWTRSASSTTNFVNVNNNNGSANTNNNPTNANGAPL